jgi:hypothetical protein
MIKRKLYILVEDMVENDRGYIYFKFLREDLPYLKKHIKEMENNKSIIGINLIGIDTKRRKQNEIQKSRLFRF